ncbi:hypothetical protein ACOSQ2_004611 [Xanthoceras sorbifolium]
MKLLNKVDKKNIQVYTSDVNCNYGLYHISGIPCMHIIFFFMYNKQFTHDQVHWYYSKESMKLTYTKVINPIPNESRRPKYENEVIEPPIKHSKVGRPKKVRRRATDEPYEPT